MSGVDQHVSETPGSKPARASRRRGPSRPVRVHDKRTSEARNYAEAVERLTAHLGGKVSATQAFLIERAAMLSIHMVRMDRRAFADGAMSEADQRCYLAWSNSLTRTMAQLGLQGAKAQPKTLADIAAEIARQRQPDAAA